MNDGVKILLERMTTHPEEFHGTYNRWTEVIEQFEKFFHPNERALINGALTNIRRDEFTQIVMQEILREPTAVDTIRRIGRMPQKVGITAEQLADIQRSVKNMPRAEPFAGEIE